MPSFCLHPLVGFGLDVGDGVVDVVAVEEVLHYPVDILGHRMKARLVQDVALALHLLVVGRRGGRGLPEKNLLKVSTFWDLE